MEKIHHLTDARTYYFELSEGVCKKEYSFDLSYILEPVNNEVELFACQDVPVDFEGQTYTSPGSDHAPSYAAAPSTISKSF